MTGLTAAELAVGDVAESTREITATVVREFVAATGDDNPVHSDPAFAAGTRFGQVIAPGILTGGLLSALIGTRLPGPGMIYLSQTFRFLRPVHIGDTVTARVEVLEIVAGRNRVRLGTACLNQRGELVLEGEAWVLPPPAHVEYRAPAAAAVGYGGLALGPAALALQLGALWAASGFAAASRALELWQPVAPGSAHEEAPVHR